MSKRVFVSGLAVVCTLGLTAGAQQAPRFVRSQLTWFDRAGKKLSVVGNMADYGNLELSPEGDRVAVAVLNDQELGVRRDIWIVDVASGRHTAFASEAADENWAIWSRDGRRIIFNSTRGGGLNLYQAASNAEKAFPGDPLLVDGDAKWPVSWSADTRYVLYVTSGPRQGNHIQVLPLFGDKKPFPFQRSDNDTENWAAFSPDGKWVAFSSTESGQTDVYVAPFPQTSSGRKWRVSKGGGSQARWRRDGKELYFLQERTIMAAAVMANGAELELRAPQALFEIKHPYGQYHAFDLTADGQRFLVNTVVVSPGTQVAAH